MFSDESKFCLSFGDKNPRMLKRRSEIFIHSVQKRLLRTPRVLWFGVAWGAEGVRPLCLLDTSVKARKYFHILENFMIPAVHHLFRGSNDYTFIRINRTKNGLR